MAQVKYLGPSDEFEYKGKKYYKGDSINLPDDVVKHHARHGHFFQKGDEVVEVAPARATATEATQGS